MPDFAAFWKNFARERKAGEWPCFRWFTRSARLTKGLAAGDRLWLFTSGKNCGLQPAAHGFLVEVFTVRGARPNPDLDRDYPVEDFPGYIEGDPDLCFAVDPPLPIDALVRPAGHEPDDAIGGLRQSPLRLPAGSATWTALLALLWRERPTLADQLRLPALTP